MSDIHQQIADATAPLDRLGGYFPHVGAVIRKCCEHILNQPTQIPAPDIGQSEVVTDMLQDGAK